MKSIWIGAKWGCVIANWKLILEIIKIRIKIENQIFEDILKEDFLHNYLNFHGSIFQ